MISSKAKSNPIKNEEKRCFVFLSIDSSHIPLDQLRCCISSIYEIESFAFIHLHSKARHPLTHLISVIIVDVVDMMAARVVVVQIAVVGHRVVVVVVIIVVHRDPRSLQIAPS